MIRIYWREPHIERIPIMKITVLAGGLSHEREVSLSEPIDTDGEGRPLTLMDVLAEEDTLPQDLERRLDLKVLRQYVDECLCPREREIIILRYGLEGAPLTQWQVAEKLGISRSYVSRLETRALGLLRRRYERPQSPH